MKNLRTLIVLTLTLCMVGFNMPLPAATVTGRNEDTSLAGTEKIPADSSGVDTYILVSKLWTSMVVASGFTASGSGANDFSGSTGTFKTSTGANTFGGSSNTFAAAITPASSDGAALGSASLQWSDLFLASGGVLNFANGDVLLTHSTGVLTLGTGNLIVTTAGTAAGSVVTNNGTQTLTNKTLTAPVIASATSSGSTALDFSGNSGAFKTSTGANTFGGSSHSFAAKLFPGTDDGAALGDTTHNFSDLFLATGAVINYANGNVVLTHTSGILTMGTGELRITTVGTNAASVPTLGSTSTLTSKTLTAPVLNGATSASGNFDLSGSSGTFKTTTGASTFGGSSATFASTITPASDDGCALGTTSLQWSDICLASGAVIKFASTDVVMTHTSGILTMGTGELRVTTPGTNSASVPTLGSTSTLTNKTLTSPVIATGLTASGSAANTFVGSTGTFITSTGANTLSGAVTVNDATTPSITLASGKTNTGFLLINGKTSGGLKLIAADAAGQTVTVSLAAQTSGAATLTVNDMAGVNASVLTSTLTSNAPSVVNSVWGASNALVWEGTADASETSLVATDPTADRTVTIPDATGTVEALNVYAHASTATVTANELYGGTLTNTGAAGAIVLTLPTPVVGMHFRVYLTVAQDVDINPDTGTTITILAATNAAGDALSSAATIGNSIEFVALSATTWAVFYSSGVWTDAN